ncbi:caprin-2 isoform X1 [Lates calcarifer]|uniref:Caprin family member 2 n=1 Tax=Lates calcarifer TaxID=8187 RepID=A0A4W6EUA3_LATCA|nr:caprin-2 isoform X1 [Lates calcarifer]XP_018552710.1 caprin-2 isoform X1 [Lates calcarifer]
MVQLSPSPTLDDTPPPERSEEGSERQDDPVMTGSPKVGSPGGLNSLQFSLEVTTAYHGYDTYIEDGLICLKHKIRNLEKKKLKLEDYKKRLNQGHVLNKDQMAAVEKYEEVLHNLEFARELHKTLDGLTQNLLRAQKKAVKKDQVAKVEVERRRLSTVLQVQHLLHSLQQEHIRRDVLVGHNQAPHIPAQQLHSLNQLATLLGVKRDNRLSLSEQMEQAALVYLDLLEGKDKPVAGSTFKLLKEELTRLLNCKYFSCLPPPPNKTPELLLSSTSHSTISKSNPNEVSKKEFFNRLYLTDMETPPAQSWKEDFQAMREREPPDCWDMEFPDRPTSPHTAVHKPWRGAATLIPKVPAATKKQSADCKQRKERKAKGEPNSKLAVHMDMPVEVFNSPSTLPKDPILRKQHLEDLMTKIHGSFSFMQDSLLDGESSPTDGHSGLKRRPSGSPSPLAETDLRSPVDVLPKAMHSTPLPTRLMERKASLTSGDQCLETCDLELSSKDLPHEPLQLADRKAFPSPPLYRRESTISVNLEEKSRPRTPVTESGKQSPCNGVGSCTSTPPQGQSFSTPPTRRTLTSAQFQNIQSVFKVNTSLPQNGELNYKPDSTVFSEPRYSTASTQTPPEFAPSEDEPQPVYQSDYTVGSGGQIFLSPGQSGGSMARPGQSYYTRGSVRGMARGGKGLAQTFRSSGWHRGGSYIPQTHLRDSGPLLYAARDSGYQHSFRRGGGRHNSSAAWSDSSQVSSPDREGAFTIVDSGHGDSLSVSTVEVPLTPHAHHHTALLPMQLYPLSQPLRVAFTASRTANFAPGNLDQPIVFDQLHSNLGEMYDTHIGRFTCPVNGTYVFIFHILKLAINVPLYINLMRNEDVMVSAYANDGAPDHETASNHAILPLFQGDQVWLRLHRGAIYGSTWKYSTFSGFLLYQD